MASKGESQVLREAYPLPYKQILKSEPFLHVPVVGDKARYPYHTCLFPHTIGYSNSGGKLGGFDQ